MSTINQTTFQCISCHRVFFVKQWRFFSIRLATGAKAAAFLCPRCATQTTLTDDDFDSSKLDRLPTKEEWFLKNPSYEVRTTEPRLLLEREIILAEQEARKQAQKKEDSRG